MTPGFLAWGQYGQSPPLTEWRFLRESSGPWDRIPPSWVRGSSLRMEPWSGQGSWSLASKWTTHQGWLGDHSSVPPPSGGLGGQAPVNPLGPAIRDQPVGTLCIPDFPTGQPVGADFYPHSQTSHISGNPRGKVICWWEEGATPSCRVPPAHNSPKRRCLSSPTPGTEILGKSQNSFFKFIW